ncbi:hypothetical protein MUP01_12355 [Candidatus Bathyarchaeota archaeon]|nr:hypothetical protein [Candidatus Bathyarchaeota archaeon]
MAKLDGEDCYKGVRVKALHDGEGVLLCPQCPNDDDASMLHITQASVHRGEDKITINSEKISIDTLKNTNRGTMIEIEYEGECGHHGLFFIHFCKGSTYICYRPLADLNVKTDSFWNLVRKETFSAIEPVPNADPFYI